MSYNRHTISLTMLTEDEYSELSQVEKGEMPYEQNPVFKSIRNSGCLYRMSWKKMSIREQK
jgi:hypothetical protein